MGAVLQASYVDAHREGAARSRRNGSDGDTVALEINGLSDDKSGSRSVTKAPTQGPGSKTASSAGVGVEVVSNVELVAVAGVVSVVDVVSDVELVTVVDVVPDVELVTVVGVVPDVEVDSHVCVVSDVEVVFGGEP